MYRDPHCKLKPRSCYLQTFSLRSYQFDGHFDISRENVFLAVCSCFCNLIGWFKKDRFWLAGRHVSVSAELEAAALARKWFFRFWGLPRKVCLKNSASSDLLPCKKTSHSFGWKSVKTISISEDFHSSSANHWENFHSFCIDNWYIFLSHVIHKGGSRIMKWGVNFCNNVR